MLLTEERGKQKKKKKQKKYLFLSGILFSVFVSLTLREKNVILCDHFVLLS